MAARYAVTVRMQTGNAIVSGLGFLTELSLSKPPKSPSLKMTSNTGILLLVFSVLVVVLDFANLFVIAISFFFMLIGIMLVMMGAMRGFEPEPEAVPSRTEVVRETVKNQVQVLQCVEF